MRNRSVNISSEAPFKYYGVVYGSLCEVMSEKVSPKWRVNMIIFRIMMIPMNMLVPTGGWCLASLDDLD
jgi:hypothetical protein